MKWYKKQLDAIMKKKEADAPTEKKSASHAVLDKKPKIIRKLPNKMEKRSRDKTDAIS